MKVHHIGYAVRDIDSALECFNKLGYVCVSQKIDELRRVRIAFIRNEETLVELVAPNGPNSPVDEMINKNGPAPYHICYTVKDIDEQCKKLKKEGWTVIIKKSQAPAIGDASVAFLFHKRIGIIEIVEESDWTDDTVNVFIGGG